MRVFVKICGITTPDAARSAALCGADAVGFVFAESPRHVSPGQARRMAAHLPRSVQRVAVLHHPTENEIEAVLRTFAPDLVQCEPVDAALRGHITGRFALFPVFHDSPALHDDIRQFHRRVPSFAGPILVEGAGRGGRGVKPDYARAAEVARTLPTVLAGGLSPENVGGAIARVQPIGVDVSSGVEAAPGIKDANKIAAFLAAVRKAESTLAAAASEAQE